ncbi:hypothetical protein, partial [Lonsdalea populi]
HLFGDGFLFDDDPNLVVRWTAPKLFNPFYQLIRICQPLFYKTWPCNPSCDVSMALAGWAFDASLSEN